VRAYQRALQLDPRNSNTWDGLGVVHSKNGAPEDAEEAFNKAIEIDRGNGWAYSNLGVLRAQQGRLQESIALLLRSLELMKDKRDKAISYNRLADVYRQANQYEDAVEAYKMADSLNHGGAATLPSQPENTAPEIEPTASTSVGQLPESTQAAEKSSEPLTETAEPQLTPEAEPAEQSSVSLDTDISTPAEAIMQDEQTNPALQEPSIEPAGEEPEPATASVVSPEPTKDDPEEKANAFAWNEKGNLHFQQGDYEHAIDAYSRAIEIDPALGWPYNNMALCYMAQGRHAEAVLLYKKSLEMLISNTDKAVSWNGLGNAYRATGDYNNAGAAYERAAELDPKTAGIREGIETFQLAPEMQSPDAWNDLGEGFLKTGAYSEASTAFRRAIELDPKLGWPYSNLARVLASQGNHSEAIPLYQKSIELLKDKKDQAVSWNRLGNTYRKLNDYDNAIKAFQEAVALNDEGMDLVTRTRFSLLSNCYAE
jgi:tetratricopeptide (TPR) repeat protein